MTPVQQYTKIISFSQLCTNSSPGSFHQLRKEPWPAMTAKTGCHLSVAFQFVCCDKDQRFHATHTTAISLVLLFWMVNLTVSSLNLYCFQTFFFNREGFKLHSFKYLLKFPTLFLLKRGKFSWYDRYLNIHLQNWALGSKSFEYMFYDWKKINWRWHFK